MDKLSGFQNTFQFGVEADSTVVFVSNDEKLESITIKKNAWQQMGNPKYFLVTVVPCDFHGKPSNG
jgi:hypothetical protein